jgi:predicted oxidoreductase (fatty acid repression mutant protein)
MKCWYSAFNAQGSRVIIVVVQLRGAKIYVAVVEGLKKNERQDETQFTTKIDGFLSFIPRIEC